MCGEAPYRVVSYGDPPTGPTFVLPLPDVSDYVDRPLVSLLSTLDLNGPPCTGMSGNPDLMARFYPAPLVKRDGTPPLVSAAPDPDPYEEIREEAKTLPPAPPSPLADQTTDAFIAEVAKNRCLADTVLQIFENVCRANGVVPPRDETEAAP